MRTSPARSAARGTPSAGPVDTAALPLREVLAYLWRLRALRHLLLATSIQTFALAAAGSWHPSFLRRVFELERLLGRSRVRTALGARGRTRHVRRRMALGPPRRARSALVPVAAGARRRALDPVRGPAYLLDSAALAIALLAPAALLHNVYAAVGHAAAQSLARPSMRAMVSAVALFAMNLIGFGLGPPAIGLLNDALTRPPGRRRDPRSLVADAVLPRLGRAALRAGRPHVPLDLRARPPRRSRDRTQRLRLAGCD